MAGSWNASVLEDAAAKLGSVQGVAGLTAGPLGTNSAYLPGRRIPGLRLADEGRRLEVHVVMTWGARADDVEAAILRAVPSDKAELVDVYIDDIEYPAARDLRAADDSAPLHGVG
jgi:hypothetical protein